VLQSGNDAATKHGVWSADVPQRARELVDVLFGVAQAEAFPMIAVRATEVWIRLRRSEADVAERGEVLEDGKPHPLLAHMRAWDNYLLQVSDRYGMTPKAQASLALERADAARTTVDLEAIRARGRASLEARELES
jgi:hypothetical protein